MSGGTPRKHPEWTPGPGQVIYRCQEPSCRTLLIDAVGSHGDRCGTCGIGRLTTQARVSDAMIRDAETNALLRGLPQAVSA